MKTGLGKCGHVLWIYDLLCLWVHMVLNICLPTGFMKFLPNCLQLAEVRWVFRDDHLSNVTEVCYIFSSIVVCHFKSIPPRPVKSLK